MHGTKNSVRVYVCECVDKYVHINLRAYLRHRGSLLSGYQRDNRKKILERFIQFNLKNKPFTSEKQTADFPSPQLNDTSKESWRKDSIALPLCRRLTGLSNWKFCTILGSLICFKVSRHRSPRGEKPVWPIYRQYHKSILAHQTIKGKNCKQETALPQPCATPPFLSPVSISWSKHYLSHLPRNHRGWQNTSSWHLL